MIHAQVHNLKKIKIPKEDISFWALTSIMVVASIDLVTQTETRIYPFYFLPIAIISIKSNRKTTMMTAFVCSLIWLSTTMMEGTQSSSHLVLVWNTIIQIASFIFVAYILSSLQFLKNAESDLARTDELTGLLNKRSFQEQGSALIELSKRGEFPIILAYLDLDNFKAVNDNQGHDKGDYILKIVATILKDTFRDSDLLGRIGGDEFVILMPNTKEDSAMEVLERLRTNIQDTMKKEGVGVTVSIGAVAYERAPTSLEDIMKYADDKMYQIKHKGKNSVQISSGL